MNSCQELPKDNNYCDFNILKYLVNKSDTLFPKFPLVFQSIQNRRQRLKSTLYRHTKELYMLLGYTNLCQFNDECYKCSVFVPVPGNNWVPGKRYIRHILGLRFPHRFLWLLVVGATSGTFTYIVIAQFMYFYKYNKSVNVEVKNARELPFPAVTICNQNFMR